MLFNKRLLKQKTNKLNLSEISNIDLLKSTLTKWQTALKESDLDKTKETGVQGQFLIKIFEGVLGYKTQSEGGSEWNMFAEPKTDVDSREADGGLGFFSTSYNQTRVVIELKDAKTNLDAKQKGRKNDQSPVEQAFDYLSKFDGCKWAIVSNFKEIRLYSKERGQGFYESIDLLEIGNEDVLKKFLFLFSKENLINKDRDSVIDDLLKDSFVKEQDISKAFYKTYKETRNHLFNHLTSNNPNINADTLLEKAQKILDRVIFICFCEDLDLIPAGIFRKLLEAAKLSFAPSETKVWDQAKGLFHSIDKGNPPLNINKFNGGLFKEDQVLDNLVIKDEIILELLKLSEYDFDSDLNVNILGHIFEQSISDLEEMRSEITEEQPEKKIGKRKKDGIFYTPEYITRYIVDQAVGGWLMDRKKELGFESLPELTDEDFKSIKTRKGTYKGNNSIERHRKFWEAYKEKLRNIKVLDPACGSGAFLNQVFDYLYKEGQVVNEAIASLKLGQAEIFDLDKHILNNNIFGVDLNEESVQITKLSLWLKTANKSKELTTLDENIKCGNSLIDDPEVAGDKAFNWKDEFKEIFNSGGFDVVVGNPPYGVNIKENKDFFAKNYISTEGPFELYKFFIEKGLRLIKRDGYLSFITPDTWVNLGYFKKLRNLMLSEYTLIKCSKSLYDIFEDANVDTAIFLLKNANSKATNFVIVDNDLQDSGNGLISLRKEDYVINLKESNSVIDKINKVQTSLDQFVEVWRGMSAYGKKNPERPYNSLTKDTEFHRPLLNGGNIGRYEIKWEGEYIKFGKWLHRPRPSYIYDNPKILIQRIRNPKLTRRIVATLDEEKYISSDGLTNLILKKEYENGVDLRYIIGLLNSKLINYWFSYNFHDVNIKPDQLRKIPLLLNNQEKIIDLVTQILSLNKQLLEERYKFLKLLGSEFNVNYADIKSLEIEKYTWKDIQKKLNIKLSSLDKNSEWLDFFEKTTHTLNDLTRSIKEKDKAIDDEVYQLYGLDLEEITQVENE